MLRLDYLFMRECLLAKGDLCTDADGDDAPMNSDIRADNWNQNEEVNSRCHIKSFALRENNGTRPVPDDFPVIALYKSGEVRNGAAGNYCWEFFGGDKEIDLWRPGYDKLLEQQNEYDKQQAIESKESKMSEFTYGQKIYVKDNNEHDFTFGCYHINGESVLFMFDGGYGMVDIDNVKATPFKTELEIAKEKQIDDALQELTDTKMMKFNRLFTRTMLEIMQSKGLLAEIILPLKDK